VCVCANATGALGSRAAAAAAARSRCSSSSSSSSGGGRLSDELWAILFSLQSTRPPIPWPVQFALYFLKSLTDGGLECLEWPRQEGKELLAIAGPSPTPTPIIIIIMLSWPPPPPPQLALLSCSAYASSSALSFSPREVASSCAEGSPQAAP
jgi:hypothetical protein